MEINLIDLVEHFAHTAFQVEGVYNYSIEPGSAGIMKTSPFPGFIFPLAGEANFIFDDTSYTAGLGNVIHGGANMMLSKSVVGKKKWNYILVLYSIRKPEPEGFSLEDSHFELIVGQSPRLVDLLQRLWRVSNQPGAIATFQTETIFRCILDEIFICARNQSSGDDHILYKQVSDYIHEYYMDTLTIRSLAELHGVNENRLFYVFSKYAGMGAGDYLMIHRLNRAKELLVTGNAPVVAVAKSVGYHDPYHFSKRFKKQFGISPSKFRDKFRYKVQ
ncbi:helix-turn-helix transcriptional regulator [Clostridium botulinum]|uniref:helix-turn-helix transcriptional regulator n=1 Tax=Clostridium botulinum TaxID=1491 RepID=UPI000773F312|nr:AraC family transcriptional regulator [Clostridium botulinum]MBY6951356.1 helix-turn-helix transcriptional regulator [Clostridium botulinum]MCR1138934.1 AraC family transcriptional regulator [Clostridium botulinum]NEZ78737.1 AraC family transcriptional regulator [Clostridium botulinum]NFA16721.1 AraC family transcriptional regulator [Clostridium botulinum]NFA51798.1 AraC family transcriptional regulator [Clostridium botulinum]